MPDQPAAELADTVVPEDVVTPEKERAANALTEEKAAANDAWLHKVGIGFWVVALVAGTWAVAATMYRNDGPAEADDVRRHATRVDRTLDRAEGLLRGGVDAEELVTLRAMADRVTNEAAAIEKAADALPGSWHGADIAGAKGAVVAHAGTLRTEADGLRTHRTADELTQDLSDLRGTLGALKAQDIRPGFDWPWEFEKDAAEGFVYAIVLTLLVLAVLTVLMGGSGGLRYFLIGGDGRLSTAQTQAAIWTVAIFFLLAHLLLRQNPGEFDHLDETYLLLLGGPYAAWVVGGAISRGKINNGDVQKVAAPEAQVRDLVCDDNGRANLVDAQFFFFSMLALVGVFVAFARDPNRLPEIPSGLAMLTGAGSLVYTGKKLVEGNTAAIFSVTRVGNGPLMPGSRIRIRGQNFLPPGAAGDVDVLTTAVTVRFIAGGTSYDQRIAPVLRPRRKPRERPEAVNLTSDTITMTLPRLPAGEATVVVIPASGLMSNEQRITVAEAVVITQIRATKTAITLVGAGLMPEGRRAFTTVTVGDLTAVPFTWQSDREVRIPVTTGVSGQVPVTVTTATGTATATVNIPAS